MVLDLRLSKKIGLSGDNLLFISFVVRKNNKSPKKGDNLLFFIYIPCAA